MQASKKSGSAQQVKPASPNAAGRGATRRRPAGTRRASQGAGAVTNEEDNCEGGVTKVTVEVPDDQVEVKRAKKPADAAMENFAMSVAKKGIDGLKAEFKEIHSYQPADQSAVSFNANKDKNRYHNILCYDRTRVVLEFNVPPDTDYIHANWVNLSAVKLTNKYICTQGPMDGTVSDFWRMIYQEKVKYVVMLCGVIENGKPKCAQYFPDKLEEIKLYGNVTVTYKKNLTAPTEKIFESIQFDVKVEGKDAFQMTLMRWLDWPDFSIPNSGMGMLRILKTIRDCKGSTAVVHCSAGVGRTGTIMGTELCLRVLAEGKELNVPEVIKELRSQRAGSIQTESQYIYLHRALCEYIHAKKLCKDELAGFFKAFAGYLQTLTSKTAASPTPAAQQALPQPIAQAHPATQPTPSQPAAAPPQKTPAIVQEAKSVIGNAVQSAVGQMAQIFPK